MALQSRGRLYPLRGMRASRRIRFSDAGQVQQRASRWFAALRFMMCTNIRVNLGKNDSAALSIILRMVGLLWIVTHITTAAWTLSMLVLTLFSFSK
jgi:hypothetical protein